MELAKYWTALDWQKGKFHFSNDEDCDMMKKILDIHEMAPEAEKWKPNPNTHPSELCWIPGWTYEPLQPELCSLRIQLDFAGHQYKVLVHVNHLETVEQLLAKIYTACRLTIEANTPIFFTNLMPCYQQVDTKLAEIEGIFECGIVMIKVGEK